MDLKKIFEWGVVIIVFVFVWRWVVAFIETLGSGNSIPSSNYYAPGYPYQPYGVVLDYNGSPVYSTGSWSGSWRRRPRRGDPGGSLRW